MDLMYLVLEVLIWNFLVQVLNDYNVMQCHAVILIFSLCCCYSNYTERSLGWRWTQPDWKKTLPRTVTGTSHLVSVCRSVHPIIVNNLNYFLSTTYRFAMTILIVLHLVWTIIWQNLLFFLLSMEFIRCMDDFAYFLLISSRRNQLWVSDLGNTTKENKFSSFTVTYLAYILTVCLWLR